MNQQDPAPTEVTQLEIVGQRELTPDELQRASQLLALAPIIFVPVKDFCGRHGNQKSSYVKGALYTLRKNNSVLAQCMAVWESMGYISIGGAAVGSDANQLAAERAEVAGTITVGN